MQARADAYSIPSGGDLYAGAARPPLAPTQLVADGIWTWFTDPRAVFRNGATYLMAVDSAGTNWIHKVVHATGVVTSFQLSSTGLEVDDHNNGSLIFRPDGRIVAFYGTHNDTVFRYRVSTNPEDITAWGAERQRGTSQGPYSYPNCFLLAQDPSKYWFFTRRWTDGSGSTRNLSLRTTSALADGDDPWSAYTDIWSVSGKIPYWRLACDDTNTIHVLTTDQHPVQGAASLYHFYGRLDGSDVMRWYESDGTEIAGTPPFGPSDATLVYDGSTTRCWVSDAVIDGDGRPRVLYMRYPGNDGSAIEYWHARWTGSAWVSHKITDDGAGLYSGEPFYPGVACFDLQDPTTFYLSAPVSGVRQIQAWRTSDIDAASTKVRDITSGGSAGNPLRLRPCSPKAHDGFISLLWCEGEYTTFTDYQTAVMGAGL